jgi:Autographiviridae endonuclease VII
MNELKTPRRKLDAMARQRAKRNADPEKLAKHQKYMKAYRRKNRDTLNAQASVLYFKKRYQKRLHRLGIEATPELLHHLDNHEGFCDLCSSPGDGRWGELAIDHCHATSSYRGMLCSSCNRALGLFKDSPELLGKAIDYLTLTQGAQQ